jgi:hypothetical protein
MFFKMKLRPIIEWQGAVGVQALVLPAVTALLPWEVQVTLTDHMIDDMVHAGIDSHSLVPVSETVQQRRRVSTLEIPKASEVADPVRQKCREMLASAMKISRKLERALHRIHILNCH